MDISKSYHILRDIADISSGYARQLLRNKQVNSQKETQLIQIVSFQEVKNYSNGINIHDDCEIVHFQQDYTKDIKYMHKGDIIIPLKSGLGTTEIIYISEEPKEKYIYDSTNLVIKVTDKNVDSLYVYIMLSQSKPIQDGLGKAKVHASLDKHGKFQPTVVPRLSKSVLSNILIRELSKKEMEEIVDEYIKITNEQKEFINKISSLQEDKDSKSHIWWL